MAPSPTPTQEENDAHYIGVLNTLIDQAADLATRIHAAPADAATDPTIPFDRIARTIRRTIALARHIAANPKPNTRINIRAKLIRGVEDAIHRKRHESDQESLKTELAERLEDPALEFDLADRPVAEIIEEICRDLGINTQQRSWVFPRRTPADIQTLRNKAALPPLPPAEEGRGEGPGSEPDPPPTPPKPAPA